MPLSVGPREQKNMQRLAITIRDLHGSTNLTVGGKQRPDDPASRTYLLHVHMQRIVPVAFRAPRYAFYQVHSFPDRSRQASCFADLFACMYRGFLLVDWTRPSLFHDRLRSISPLHAVKSHMYHSPQRERAYGVDEWRF
jgi:hypothetical protein